MKLKTRVLILTAAVFFAVLSASYLMFNWFKADILQGLGTVYAEQQLLYSRARSLQPLLRELALARKMADSPTIRAWARNEFDPVMRAAGLAQLEEYRRFFADGSVFLVIDDSLNYYYNDRDRKYTGKERRYVLSPDNPEDGWYFRTSESAEPYRLNVDYDENLGVTKVWMNVVIREADGEGALGIVGTGIDLTDFLGAVVSSTEPGVVNVFTDADGAVQAHDEVELIDFRSISKSPDERKTIFDLLDDEEQRAELARAMKRVKAQEVDDVGVVFASLGGREHLVGVIDLPEIGWYGMVFMDAEKLIGSNRFLPFAGLFLLALILLSLSLVFLLERFVTGPISRLDARMDRFARGTLPEPLPVSDSEMGRLEKAFAQMATRVRRYTDDLEHEVRERTRELNDKNERLESALAEIRTLTGLLPTCMYCKKIRDDDGNWHGMEEYISEHSDARVSHGVCPSCMNRARRDLGLGD